MSWLLDVLGLLLLAWALGMSVTVVLLDSGTGFLRDHPPRAWRMAGAMAGPLALLSFLSLLVCGAPLWLCVAVVLPFALMDLAYSWSWLRGYGAERRRQLGREALILGVITVLFVSLEQSLATEQSALVLALSAGSASLLGGLGTTLLISLLGGRRDEVETPATPYGTPARVVATGLAITLLALLDTLFVSGRGGALIPLAVWVAFSLLLPLGLVAAGHGLFPRLQLPIWALAFGSVLVGQAALHMVVLS